MEAAWLAGLVENMWPYVKEVIHKQAWDTLPDMLDESKASWMVALSLRSFALGDSPPSVSNITSVKETTITGADTLHLDFDFAWEGGQSIVLEVVPLPKFVEDLVPDIVSNTIERMTSFQFGISKFRLRSRCRMTFEPLIYEQPLFGDVKFCLMKQPDLLDFEMSLEKGVISLLSPLLAVLKQWVIQFLRVAVISYFIFPEQFVYSVAPEVETIEVPQGLVEVKVLEAKNIPKVDILTSAEPYVAVWVREKKKRMTSVPGKAQNAVWNTHFQLPVVDRHHQVLTFCIYDHNPLGGDDELGRALLELWSMPTEKEEEHWLTLRPIGQQEAEEEIRNQLDTYTGFQRSMRESLIQAGRASTGSTKDCRLHVKVIYHEISENDMRAIAEYKRNKDRVEFMRIVENPILHELASSGNLRVRIGAVSKLAPTWLSWICSRYILVKLKVDDQEMITSSSRGSSRAARIEQELQVELRSENGEHRSDLEIRIEAYDTTFGTNILGHMSFPFSELKEVCHIHGKYPLEKEKYRPNSGDRHHHAGNVDVDMRWEPFLL